MKNYIILFFIAVSIHLIFSNGACHKVSPNHLKLFHKEVTRSIIGITGKDSTDAYIEIFYTKKKTDTTNEVVHLWVKPPYLFGDEPVISQVRRVYHEYGHSKGYGEYAYFTFTEGGDSYLKIVNHSNNPIEMFVVVNFETTTYNGKNMNIKPECQNKYYLRYHPRPMYKNAPIYYLLFPDKTPNINNVNVIDFNDCCDVKDLSYTSTKVGDISINRAWTMEEVMSLYRAEYRLSPDTILEAYYSKSMNTSRISILPDGYNKNYWYDSDKDIYIPIFMYGFYKKISGQSSFLSQDNQYYLMTNALYNNVLQDSYLP